MCVFCDISSGKIKAKKVYEDEKYLAFLDISPLNPGHALFIPKKHISNFWDMDDKTTTELFVRAKSLSKKMMDKLNPQRVMLAVIGVDVPHVHIHLIPRYEGDGHGGAINFKLRSSPSPEQLDQIVKKLSC